MNESVKYWNNQISKIEKYYPNAKVNNDPQKIIYELHVSNKNKWILDLLRYVRGNMNLGSRCEEYTLRLEIGTNKTIVYQDDENNTRYTIATKIWNNNVLLVVIQIEKIVKVHHGILY